MTIINLTPTSIRASRHEDEITKLQQEIDTLDAETYRAEQVRDRIKDLISVE